MVDDVLDDGIPKFYGKDETPWYKQKPPAIRKLPGVKNAAKQAKTIMNCWKLFISDEMIKYIVKYTNQRLDLMTSSFHRPRDCPQTDYEEILAFIGLLYLAAVKKGQHLNTEELWKSDGTAPDFFAATMSKKRFHQLVQSIRFEDATKRLETSAIGNLAPVRETFQSFVTNVKVLILPDSVTNDEMLESFRDRCRFRQYIANKPAKYGIKIYALVDSRTFFTSNLEIYADKQPEELFQVKNDAASVVMRLIEPISKTGRNVTTDNYFTSVTYYLITAFWYHIYQSRTKTCYYCQLCIIMIRSMKKQEKLISPKILQISTLQREGGRCGRQNES
ncbi:hypothetical protein NQ314_001531 [Rhamnusium bicolor]|uniref:PiggyBac transposable element-derived protein domain-containing protein n=1 Tax=Rhamnusium bicolor TaxID=1586634 RepID=A0AAV8ZS28_9CUCU|nr:hypothetical protein NQ314_001531 [Rhamnusium bicolor]